MARWSLACVIIKTGLAKYTTGAIRVYCPNMHPVIHTVVRGTKVSYFLPFPLFEAKLWYVNPSKPFKKHT